jgi:hypothetical protein
MTLGKTIRRGLLAAAATTGALWMAGAPADAQPANHCADAVTLMQYHKALGDFWLSQGDSGRARYEYGIVEGISEACGA